MADVAREYHYRVDGEGRVFHDGSEIVDAATLRFFHHAMTRTPEGRWLAVCQGERNWFDAEDTPFVVRRLRLDAPRGALEAAELVLAGDAHEPLDPGGLESAGGHLYCPVRRGLFRARLGRIALQQLAPYLVADAGGPALLLGGARHPIRVPAPAGS
jgi:hypothetical protein